MYFDVLVYNGNIHTFENPYDIYRSMLIKDGKIVKLYKENYVEDEIDLKNDVGKMINLYNQTVIPSFIVKDVYMLPLLLFKYNKYLKFNTLGEAEVYFGNLDSKTQKQILSDGNDYLLNKGISTIILKEDNYSESVNNRVNEYLIHHSTIKYLKKKSNRRIINNDTIINAAEHFPDLDPLNKVKKSIKENMYPYLAIKKELYIEAKEAEHLNDMGIINENYYANFMILNKDIFVPEDNNYKDLKIIKTYAFGEEVKKIKHKNTIDNIRKVILKKEA